MYGFCILIEFPLPVFPIVPVAVTDVVFPEFPPVFVFVVVTE